MGGIDNRGQAGSGIALERLGVGYGATAVLEGVDLEVAPGEFVALLGPSGCGKTTLLRAIAGFVPVASGTVRLNGKDLANVPPERRGTAMMFQSYALWPHMSVAQNVGYGLRLRGGSRDEIARRVAELLDLVGLREYGARKPSALSGGQRQRVALARALSINPPVLLLDEPLSNLDAGIRASMRHEIRALQQRLGLTTILVTHDQVEALTMADRIVVLRDGGIAQVGTPEDVYNRPSDPHVARFMGAGNELPVAFAGEDGGSSIRLAETAPPDARRFQMLFRSEAARIASPEQAGASGFSASGVVTRSSYLGSVYRHVLDVGGHEVTVDHPDRIHVGAAVGMCVPAAGFSLFPDDRTGAAGSKAEAPIASHTGRRGKHHAT